MDIPAVLAIYGAACLTTLAIVRLLTRRAERLEYRFEVIGLDGQVTTIVEYLTVWNNGFLDWALRTEATRNELDFKRAAQMLALDEDGRTDTRVRQPLATANAATRTEAVTC